MNNSSPSEFDNYVDSYEDALKQSMPSAFTENEYFAQYKINYIARKLGKQKPTSFLDFGCGIGRSISIINQQFPQTELWGYDISSQSIEAARMRTKKAQFTNDLNDFPFGKFDVIFAANVFHHIPLSERISALTRCKQLLAKNGRLFLFEHNPFNPVTRLVFERCPYDKDAVMLKKQEVLQLAEKVGLNVTKSSYTLFFPRPLALFRPLERILGWLPMGAQYCVEMTKG
ncbi:MAG: class I SAM-dependent methyltransferase [Gammaproteobacteria bacterium]